MCYPFCPLTARCQVYAPLPNLTFRLALRAVPCRALVSTFCAVVADVFLFTNPPPTRAAPWTGFFVNYFPCFSWSFLFFFVFFGNAVKVHFKPIANAPILRKSKFQVNAAWTCSEVRHGKYCKSQSSKLCPPLSCMQLQPPLLGYPLQYDILSHT